MYKTKLSHAEAKFLTYQTAAVEWKEVADDRLAVISAYAVTLGVALSHLGNLGEVLGVRPPEAFVDLTTSDPVTPEETVSALCRNIELTLTYALELTYSARATSESLESTLKMVSELSDSVHPKDQGGSRQVIARSADLSKRIMEIERNGGLAPAAGPQVISTPSPKQRRLATRMPTPKAGVGQDLFD